MNFVCTVDETTSRTVIAPRVSIIMPTYNYGRFIEQTLKSVQAQTYAHWECIIVDDGSTDDTREVVCNLAKRDGRIKYIYQENTRQAAARNNALQHIEGNYVQFLDADDLLENQKLEHQVGYLEAHPEIDIVYGSVRYFTDGRPTERLFSMCGLNRRWMPETSGAGSAVVKELLGRNMLAINSALIRREVVEAVGVFDEALPVVEDWDFFLRCALAGKRFQFLDEAKTLALVRVHPTSSSQNFMQLVQSEMLLRDKLAAKLAAQSAMDGDNEMRMINERLRVQLEGQFGIQQVLRGDTREGFRRMLRTSAKSDRLWLKAKWLTYGLISTVATKNLFERMANTPRENVGGLFKVLFPRWEMTKGEPSKGGGSP